jgi:excinuclease ABC subunit C
MIKTELDEISGIGSKTKNLLLKNYKSIDKIKRIPENELSSLIGLYRAKIIVDYFSK